MTAPDRTLAWTLARAHLRRRRTQNVLTILGIAVGVMALIAALSLTNGFTRALISATLRASPHLSVTAYTPSGPSPDLEQAIRADGRVQAFTPFLADKGLLTRPASSGRAAGVDFTTLFGVSRDAARVLDLPPEERLMLGTLKDGEVMLGAALARSVGAFSGEEVRLLNSSQRRTTLKVRGVFQTGNYLIDSAYAFTNLRTLQQLQGTTTITGYQLRLHNPDLAPRVGEDLTRTRAYAALPWQSLYGTLLDQLALQKRVIAFVVLLIVVVAAFGIANVLTLAVFEKTQEIAILRAIGATRTLITRVFLIEGLILGFGGLLLGNVLGLGISAYFTVRPFTLPGDLYFITTLPVEVKVTDILAVNAIGLTTTLLAALIPARRAASVEPGRIIR
ncbi:lipoprotein releasing system, permease, LolC/E family [Deinococcus grandis]|uniref:Lipoprotein releasing system, permease, LolC/E family n=1 Tax=Deinococcus grandis TaxID=57498 RepID=A0A100HK49_9DEIO|nr:ABC transporter permease [Deinococcus grandis]BBN94278.1 ABC transporter permease [Deinococcus grandis]GAQ22218.1 lipoprotein releasing system, permease, LolC/E family [Deinococcus grandis]